MATAGEQRKIDPLLTTPTGPLVIQPFSGTGEVDLSLVVPTLNEAANISALIERITAVLDGVKDLRYEVIVVDDDSGDGTWKMAAVLAEKYPHLRVMRRQGERGLATAVVRGWQNARGGVLGVIDADLQHPPETAARLWGAMARGADLAVANRHAPDGGVSDWSLFRRAISRGAQAIGLVLLPEVLGRVRDPMSGYLMVRRAAVQGIELRPVGYKILIEVLARGRVKEIREVSYTFLERAQGSSKATPQVYREYLQQLMRLRIDLLKRRDR